MSTLFYSEVVSNFVKYPIFGCPKKLKNIDRIDNLWIFDKKQKAFPEMVFPAE